jgi:malate/lactate dehydrogenase
VEKVLEIQLSPREREAFQASAATLKQVAAGLGL